MTASVGTGTEGPAAEDFRLFSMSRCWQALKSGDVSRIRLAIKKMHLRWYHARPQYLKSIFTNAGVPKIAIDQVDEVCRACPVCRSWQQPTNKAKVAVRPVHDFNEELQLDLMFYKTQVNPNYLKLKNSKPYQQRHKVAKIWSKDKMVIPKGLKLSACRAKDTSKVTKTVLHVIDIAT